MPFRQLGRLEEELAVYKRLISDYCDDPTPGAHQAVTRARELLRKIGHDADR